MDMLIQMITRICIFFGECVGNCLYALWTGVLRNSQSGGFTRSSKPTKAQQAEEEENRRIAGCQEVVTYFATVHGYIARECMSREELEEKIDKGITPERLSKEINTRIRMCPGIILGENSYFNDTTEIKLPASLRDRHTYIIGKSGSGKTNMIRNMVLQDLQYGNGIGVLAPEQELLTEEILPYIPHDRIDDVVYMNPSDTEYPIPFNPLQLDEGEDIDLRVDDGVTIFKRLMGDTGARMDEILRQSLYALLERQGSTLLDIERLLGRQDDTLRQEIIQQVATPKPCIFSGMSTRPTPKMHIYPLPAV